MEENYDTALYITRSSATEKTYSASRIFPGTLHTGISLIVTYLLSCTVSKLWPIIGQIFDIDMEVPHFNALAGGDPLRISE